MEQFSVLNHMNNFFLIFFFANLFPFCPLTSLTQDNYDDDDDDADNAVVPVTSYIMSTENCSVFIYLGLFYG